jgi:hypothetical protein
LPPERPPYQVRDHQHRPRFSAWELEQALEQFERH